MEEKKLKQKILDAMETFEKTSGEKIRLIRITRDQFKELCDDMPELNKVYTPGDYPLLNSAKVDVCDPIPTLDCRNIARERVDSDG